MWTNLVARKKNFLQNAWTITLWFCNVNVVSVWYRPIGENKNSKTKWQLHRFIPTIIISSNIVYKAYMKWLGMLLPGCEPVVLRVCPWASWLRVVLYRRTTSRGQILQLDTRPDYVQMGFGSLDRNIFSEHNKSTENEQRGGRKLSGWFWKCPLVQNSGRCKLSYIGMTENVGYRR